MRDMMAKKEIEYYSLACVALLIFVSIFTFRPLVYIAFLIEIFRLLRYGTKTLLMDLAFLFSFANVFRGFGGISFVAYLFLIVDLYYIINKRITLNNSFLLIASLLVYMFFRMETELSSMVLIVSSLILIYFSIKDINSEDALKIIKMFCLGVLITSIFAYIIKDIGVLQKYVNSTAVSKEDQTIRFSGLLEDPNYYASNLILAITFLMILLYYKHITLPVFLIGTGAFLLFGIFTYSKSFFIEVIFVYCFGLLFLLNKRKYNVFLCLVLLGGFCLLAVFSGRIGLLNPLINRFKAAENINELTTGRFDLWIAYLGKTMGTLSSCLFGFGFNAKALQFGTHNIFLEMLYFTGVTGFLLFMTFIISMIVWVHREKGLKGERFIQYVPFILILVIYFALQGMFSISFYSQIFLALCAMKIAESHVLKKGEALYDK